MRSVVSLPSGKRSCNLHIFHIHVYSVTTQLTRCIDVNNFDKNSFDERMKPFSQNIKYSLYFMLMIIINKRYVRSYQL